MERRARKLPEIVGTSRCLGGALGVEGGGNQEEKGGRDGGEKAVVPRHAGVVRKGVGAPLPGHRWIRVGPRVGEWAPGGKTRGGGL